MVETMPPLLAAGSRFIAVGLILLPILAWRRGARRGSPSRAELLAAGFVGLMLPGANAVICVAEQTVPSGLAALLIASIPLWVILLRRVHGRARSRGSSLGAVLVGFGGLALLLKPEGEATILGLLACIGARDHVGDRLVRLAAHQRSRATRSSPPPGRACSAASSSSPSASSAGEARRRAPRRVVRRARSAG